MYNIGDKVVFIGEDIFNNLLKYNIYTIDHIFGDFTLSVEEDEYSHDFSNFVPLVEYRKQKINKIKERINGRM